jgi:hypothetical protein
MKMRRREHSHEASATGSGAFPNEAIRVLTLIAARHAATAQFVQACNLVGIDPTAAGEWIGKARSDTFMSVMQAATIRGNPSAWLSLLRDAKANGVR